MYLRVKSLFAFHFILQRTRDNLRVLKGLPWRAQYVFRKDGVANGWGPGSVMWQTEKDMRNEESQRT